MRANGVFAEVLRNFENQAVAVVVGFERVQDRRQMTSSKDTSTTAPMTCAPCLRPSQLRRLPPCSGCLGRSRLAPQRLWPLRPSWG